MSEWYYYHNKIYDSSTSVLSLDNRAFNYGDGFFETIKIVDKSPQYWDLHIQRIFEGCEILSMLPPSENVLLEAIEKLISHIHLNAIGRLKLIIFRSVGGLYKPSQNTTEFMLSLKIVNEQVSQNKTIGICPIPLKMYTPFSKFKTLNTMPYIYAGIYMKQKNWDDVVVLNSSGRICESLSSNIFWESNSIKYTVPISEGCVSGVMRHIYIKENHVEEKVCTIQELLDADKIFVSNAIVGIREINLLRNE